MFSAVNNVTSYAYAYTPDKNTAMKCAKTMLIGTIVLEAISNIPGASAGPVTYAACLLGCSFATPQALPMCLAACSASLGPWCP